MSANTAPLPRGHIEDDGADLGLTSAAGRIVLDSLRALTAWFAALMLVFAALDWWVLPGPSIPQGPDLRPVASGLAVATAAVLASVTLGLRRRPPPLRWANPLAFGVGLVGLLRTLCYLVVDPEPVRVLLLAILVVAAGCVFLSRRWFAAFVATAALSWYAVAYVLAPDGEWSATWLVTISAAAVAAVVLTVRRRSLAATLEARRLDARLSRDLAARVRLGEILATISTRFLTLPSGGFDRAVEQSLRELGEALGADHAFVCRVDGDPLRTSVVYEWAAPGVEPRKPILQDVPLAGQDWFCRRLLSGEPMLVEDVSRLSPEAAVERASLGRLGTVAFLAVPLIREQAAPWGYFGLAHDSRPTEWSPDEINLLRVVGDIFLSAMERQRAEAAVRLSEARFRGLYEADIIGVFFADVYGGVSDANGAFLATVGYSRADLPLRWDRLTPPEWRAHDEAAVLRLLKYGVDPPWEKEFFRKDGTRVPILIGGAVLSHQTGECVAFVLDLTERKEAERKIQRLNAELERAARLGTMGEMAAGLAHEIHQPLAAIANYANGARRRLGRGRLPDDELDHVFAEIAAQCDRAGSVIRNVRAFVRGRHPVRRAVDLNETVLECLGLARFDVRRREVEVVTEFATGVPPVLTDVTQLSQILLNLILNAVQAMEGSRGPRRLLIRTGVEGEETVLLSVGDTGPGVSPEARDRLFDQFFTTKPEGLGMGLAISRSIAESHGGRLDLARTGPDGTEFVLRLPAAHDGVAPHSRPVPGDSLDAAGRPERVARS